MNRLAYVTLNSMKKVSVYKSLPEYSICSFRGSLHRNSSENKKGNQRNHPTPSAPVFSTYLPHLFANLCALCPSHLCTCVFTQVNLHNGSYVCCFFSLFVFFSSPFTVPLHVSLSISFFASTSPCAKGRHCFT